MTMREVVPPSSEVADAEALGAAHALGCVLLAMLVVLPALGFVAWLWWWA